jgi:MscS family membrane protein
MLLLLWPAQTPAPGQVPNPAPARAAQAEPPKDHLGRSTPRGTVLGFLNAARKGTDQLAVQYLNTRLRGKAAAELAHQLFVVLDRRLPAKLQKLSDNPEGSLSAPLEPGQDLVGTIKAASRDVDILVERVDRGALGPVWLFSRETLAAIPELYQEVDVSLIDNVFPAFLVRTRLADIPLYEWLAVFVALPFLYLATVIANRLLCILAGQAVRHLFRRPHFKDPGLLPQPVRLLAIALIIYWTISWASLPLLARQFWSGFAAAVTIISFVWIVVLVNGKSERYLRARLARRNNAGVASVTRFLRRAADLLAVFVGLLVTMRYFGLNPTAALAGLGVGGIAVALAAQKTLENVIGGFSIIFDKAVNVGDFLKIGDTLGTVEEIGLRSTRIRTLDRTLVSIPNGQIANVSLETISARDKFWFHHVFGLRYDTTATQIRSILAELRTLLGEHPTVERESVDVRFLKFGTSSLELEVVAYLFADTFVHFMEIQSGLLLRLMETVQAAGAQVALQMPVISLPPPPVFRPRTFAAAAESASAGAESSGGKEGPATVRAPR